MIPRTKVNYGWVALVKSAFVRSRGDRYRSLLARLLRDYFGIRNVMLTPSGRGGLYAILRVLTQPKVVVPAYTCSAVVEAAQFAGKEVVYVDTPEDEFNVHADRLADVLDEHCVLIATHQFGIPCDIEAMAELCRQRGAFLVEDCAPSFGTRVSGQLTGTFGDAAFFSFDSTKLINTPMKGGFLAVQDDDLFRRIVEDQASYMRPMGLVLKLKNLFLASMLLMIEQPSIYRLFHNLMFRWRGRYTQESHELARSPNDFYLTEMAEWQAYLTCDQIQNADALIERRRAQYHTYREVLASYRRIIAPPRDERGEWACIRFPILVRGDKLKYYDQAVERGVDFAFSFTFIQCPDSCVNAQKLASRVLDLPYYAKLSDAEQAEVIETLHELEEAPQ